MGFRNNICVVGAGQWGNNHIRTLDKLNALKGIVEPDLDVLHKFLHKYPGVSGHTDLSEALKEEYDGFTVATPAETHFSVAKEIIQSGKPVLVEKPMALSVSDAEELLGLSEMFLLEKERRFGTFHIFNQEP